MIHVYYVCFKVPLGVILLNENKIDEMCQIMDILHKYVPRFNTKETILLPNGEEYSFDTDNLFKILVGGDQLTVTRARSSIGIRRTHTTNTEKLHGLIPVVEDWHTRLTLMQVSTQCMYLDHHDNLH